MPRPPINSKSLPPGENPGSRLFSFLPVSAAQSNSVDDLTRLSVSGVICK